VGSWSLPDSGTSNDRARVFTTRGGPRSHEPGLRSSSHFFVLGLGVTSDIKLKYLGNDAKRYIRFLEFQRDRHCRSARDGELCVMPAITAFAVVLNF